MENDLEFELFDWEMSARHWQRKAEDALLQLQIYKNKYAELEQAYLALKDSVS